MTIFCSPCVIACPYLHFYLLLLLFIFLCHSDVRVYLKLFFRMQLQMIFQMTPLMFKVSLRCTLKLLAVTCCNMMGIEQRRISLTSFKIIGIKLPNQAQLNLLQRKMSYKEGDYPSSFVFCISWIAVLLILKETAKST